MIAGTDCGFGTFAGIGKIDPDVAYKKLAALVAGAELASWTEPELVTELEELLIERACERLDRRLGHASTIERDWAALAALYARRRRRRTTERPAARGREPRSKPPTPPGPPERVTRHLCTNLRVDVDGPDSAHATDRV